MKYLFYFLLLYSNSLFSQLNWEESNLHIQVNSIRKTNGLNELKFVKLDNLVMDEFINNLEDPKDTSLESLNKIIFNVNNWCDVYFANQNIHINYGYIVTSSNKYKDADLLLNIINSNERTIVNLNDIEYDLIKRWEYRIKNKRIIFIYIISYRT